jgi:hypothetical protein
MATKKEGIYFQSWNKLWVLYGMIKINIPNNGSMRNRALS